MRKYISTIPYVLFGLMALVAFASSCTESFEERCRRETREFNEKQCPRKLDEYVTIDSMAYVEQPQGFVYYYTLSDEGIKEGYMTDEIKEQFIDQMRQKVRSDINMKTYKEKGFTFTYIYRSRAQGTLLFDASFGPEDYQSTP